MNIKLQARLFSTYRRVFRRYEEPAAPIDERGIECQDGWYGLIDELAWAAEQEIEKLVAQEVPAYEWPRVSQIKEKFGGLRFYISGKVSDSFLRLREDICYQRSFRVCEACGGPGRLTNGQTLCDACENDRSKESSKTLKDLKREHQKTLELLKTRDIYESKGERNAF